MEITIAEKLLQVSNDLSQLFVAKEFMHKCCMKLGRVECNLLQFLANSEEQISMKELAKSMGVSHSRITHLMDSLVRKGFINRISSREDRRVYLAEITPEGKDIAQLYLKENLKLHEEFVKKYPEDKLLAYYEALNVYYKTMNELIKEQDER